MFIMRKNFFKGAKKVVTLALTAVIAFQGSNLVKAEDYVGGHAEVSDKMAFCKWRLCVPADTK